MPSLFSGVNVALRAVLAHQQAIEIIEHNVANAATPGYRRQQAVLTAGPPYAPPSLQGSLRPGQMGTGVMVESVRRFNLEFFDGRYRQELAEAKRWEIERQTLTQAEATLAETSEDGLVPKMDAFWEGWQSLSGDPTNTALRADVRERARILASAFNRRAVALNDLRADQDQAVAQTVSEVNGLASQVAQLNSQISNVQAAGNQPNDLLDARDLALDRLAELVGASAATQANGEVLVSIGGHALVVGTSTFQLTAAPNAANNNLMAVTWADGQALNAPSGELAGVLDVRDRVIPDQLAALNSAARTLADRVNVLHRAGYGPPPANATGLDFFEPFTTTDYALEIRLSANVDDLANIAAANAPDSPGDGSAALGIAGVRAELLMVGGTATLDQYYTGQVAALGLEVQTAGSRADDHGLVTQSLNAQRESTSGVSLDEEAAQLVQSQRSYEAAARLMTALDDMLDRVINGMGRVGL